MQFPLGSLHPFGDQKSDTNFPSHKIIDNYPGNSNIKTLLLLAIQWKLGGV
jgi:hypothetical protein